MMSISCGVEGFPYGMPSFPAKEAPELHLAVEMKPVEDSGGVAHAAFGERCRVLQLLPSKDVALAGARDTFEFGEQQAKGNAKLKNKSGKKETRGTLRKKECNKKILTPTRSNRSCAGSQA